LKGACFHQRGIQWFAVYLRIKRVRSDFVGRKLGLIRERLVTVVAAESTDSLPWNWGTQINVMESGVDERVVRRV